MTESLLNNRYRVVRVLGTGGFGETFLAEDTQMPSGRACAIKHLKPITHNPEVYKLIQDRFQREAAILEELGEGHPQIPRLYAYFAEQGEFYLVQEWIQGITLKHKLQQEGRFSEATIREFLQTLLPVLDYVHSRGIIHRDIKPDNIILRQQDGKPVLIDFGIAKEVMSSIITAQGHLAPSLVVGTPGFMPPEQVAGKPVYATDLYSLGLTVIYLLTGKLPQQLTNHPGTGELNWQEYAPTISPDLARVLNRVTQSSASDRYPTASEMLDALQSQAVSNRQPYLATSASSPPAAPSLPSVSTETLPLGTDQSSSKRHALPTHLKSIETIPQVSKPLLWGDREAYRNRQILLNKVKNYWIKGVLDASLHDRVWIELGIQERPEAIEHPWQMTWETPEQSRQVLSASTRAINKFDELGMGRTLLILGDPGSGKTTTLLNLTRDLLYRAETDPDQPIPVVFNLSSWSLERGAIADWVVQELKTKYQVARELGQRWVNEQCLLLMLDGLDEVRRDRQNACVQAINQFSQEYGQTEMVVCSRLQDYTALSTQLRFQAALALQPLSPAQIQQSLAQAGPNLATLNHALESDRSLQALIQSPLMLSILILVYQGVAIDELPNQSLEARRHHLFEAYIDRMFQRQMGRIPYSKPQFMRWLTWLARQMVQDSQTIFLIERMQPDWLRTPRQKWLYAIGVGLLGGTITGLAGGINVELIFRNGIGLSAGLILGMAGGLIAGLLMGLVIRQIEPMETLKWSWAKAKASLGMGLRVGCIVGILSAISSGLIMSIITNQPRAMTEGLVYGLSGFGTGILFILLRGLTGASIETSTLPNQGIWQSARNAIAFSLIGISSLGSLAYLMEVPFLFGAVVGILFGLFSPAGLACVQHLVLRLILYANGNLPWNYARFLDYATRLIFLQKVGGSYIFIHRLLLEHFAQIP